MAASYFRRQRHTTASLIQSDLAAAYLSPPLDQQVPPNFLAYPLHNSL
jgi:hypothetical protein